MYDTKRTSFSKEERQVLRPYNVIVKKLQSHMNDKKMYITLHN